MHRLVGYLIAAIFILLLFNAKAYAYIDPGTGGDVLPDNHPPLRGYRRLLGYLQTVRQKLLLEKERRG